MGRAALQLLALLSVFILTFANTAQATIVTATITGTVYGGTDQGTGGQGVFGPAGSLTGQNFTLVFTFDEAKGQQSAKSASGVPYWSGIVGGGSATLTIEGTTVSFPLSGDSGASSTAWRNVGNGVNEVYFGVADLSAGNLNSVQADLGPGSGPLMTTNSDWREPFSYQFSAGISNTNNSFSYTLYSTNNVSQKATGTLQASSIVISGVDRTLKDLGACYCNPSSPATAEGDPIDAGTGNKFQAETDFTGGPSTGLSLVRYYNSADPKSSTFGAKWRSTWHRSLTVQSSTAAVVATRADGRQYAFWRNNGGSYTSDPDVTTTLKPSSNGWLLAAPDDSVEMYDFAGTLLSVKTRASQTTTLSYNTSGQLSRVTGQFGHILSFSYDASGRVSQVTAPDGGVYAYAYDAKGNLASVTRPDGKVRTYVYENTDFPNALTGLVDENGARSATWTYNTRGLATSSKLAGGANATTLAYNSSGKTDVTDARGNTHTYTFASFFDATKPLYLTGTPVQTSGGSQFSYDANGFLASRKDWNGNVTTYVHDARGNETSRTEASGTSLARVIATSWHATFHLPLQIVEPNRTTQLSYDGSGNLLTKTVTAGSLTRSWSYTYNGYGQVLTAKDPKGNVTTYTYDAKGGPASITDALGHVTKYTSYDLNGRLLSMTDPNGLVTVLTYDKIGRLTSKTAGAEKTAYAYDAVGNLTQLTRPDGSYFAFTYDAARRLTTIRDALGNTIVYTLDAAGNRTQIRVYDPTKALRRTRSFAYDSMNHLAKETGAQNQATSYTYDLQGNLTGVTDPLNHVTKYTYDNLNRLIRATDPNGGATAYAYDANDHLTGVTDPRGLVTSYTYDGLDNETVLVSPDTGTAARTFDAAGNVATSTDARGLKTTYSYDALNRRTRAALASGTSITWTYDGGTNGVGHLTAMTDSTGSTNYTYDQHGRILTKTQVTISRLFKVSYGYDAYGRLSSIIYPSGKLITYVYDAAGRLNKLTSGIPLLLNASYFPFGGVTGWTQGNGLAYSRTLNTDAQATAIGIGGATPSSVAFTYDMASRITAISETGLPKKTFGYDALDRLTSFVNGTATTTYTYDTDGNRTRLSEPAGTTAYTYPSGSNRLSSSSGHRSESDTYDATGNETSDGTRSFVYDARGRMASVTRSGVITKYGVNGLGQRVLKSGTAVPTGANTFVYDERGHLLGEYGATGALIEETVWLGDNPTVVLTGSGATAAIAYVAPDQLGSPHIITDKIGKKLWSWDHLAFGDNPPNQNPSGLVFAYNLRFPGQYADAESGLSYNYFRDYNPTTGRYIELDLIGLAGGINTYGYAGANSVTHTDKRGLDSPYANIPVLGSLSPTEVNSLANGVPLPGPNILGQMGQAWAVVTAPALAAIGSGAGAGLAAVGETILGNATAYLYDAAAYANTVPLLGGIVGYGTVHFGAEDAPELYGEVANLWARYGAMAAKTQEYWEDYEMTYPEESSQRNGACATR